MIIIYRISSYKARWCYLLHCLQMWVLLEITKFHLDKSVPDAGIIRNADTVQGRALYEEIR